MLAQTATAIAWIIEASTKLGSERVWADVACLPIAADSMLCSGVKSAWNYLLQLILPKVYSVRCARLPQADLPAETCCTPADHLSPHGTRTSQWLSPSFIPSVDRPRQCRAVRRHRGDDRVAVGRCWEFHFEQRRRRDGHWTTSRMYAASHTNVELPRAVRRAAWDRRTRARLQPSALPA